MAVNYSDFKKIRANNVVFNSAGTSLTANNSDEAIRQLDVKVNDVTVSGVGGGGSSPGVQPQFIAVNPNIDEVEGECYHTWANADAYIQTQTVDANHRWVIKIDGVNSENIVVREYVTILGEPNTTILTGMVISSVYLSVGMDTTKARIINCRIRDMSLSSGNQFIQLSGCYLDGGIPMGGFLQVFDGAVTAGDYRGLDTLQLFNVMVIGGMLPPNLQMVNGELYDNYHLSGGSLEGVLVTGSGNQVVLTTTTCRFDRCKIKIGFDVTNHIYFTNCVFDDVSFLTSPAGFITTKGCVGNFSVSGFADNWENIGDVYNFKESGFSENDVQSALDKLVYNERNVVNLVSDRGAVQLDFNKGSIFKLDITEDCNMMYTNIPPTGKSREVLLFVQQPSGTNYNLGWGDTYIENGGDYIIAVGQEAMFIFKIYVIGGNVYSKMIAKELVYSP